MKNHFKISLKLEKYVFKVFLRYSLTQLGNFHLFIVTVSSGAMDVG